jgi:hypothetical protein
MPLKSNVRPLRMPYSTAQLKRYRRRFGWAFLASFAVLLISGVVLFALPTPTSSNQPPVNVNPGPPSDPGPGGSGGGGGHANPPGTGTSSTAPNSTDLSLFVSAAALLTSTASFAGFFFTSIVAWRKERREQLHSELDLEKKRLELEKLRSELQSKQEQPRRPE